VAPTATLAPADRATNTLTASTAPLAAITGTGGPG
jgi:hypothetical protein